MIVYICLFCNDEMCSDSYKKVVPAGQEAWIGDHSDVLCVQAKYITKLDGGGEVDIGAGNAFGGGGDEDAGGKDEGVTVCNLVEAHKLME